MTMRKHHRSMLYSMLNAIPRYDLHLPLCELPRKPPETLCQGDYTIEIHENETYMFVSLWYIRNVYGVLGIVEKEKQKAYIDCAIISNEEDVKMMGMVQTCLAFLGERNVKQVFIIDKTIYNTDAEDSVYDICMEKYGMSWYEKHFGFTIAKDEPSLFWDDNYMTKHL